MAAERPAWERVAGHHIGQAGCVGELHIGRKAMQPRRGEVRTFYAQAEPLLAHPVIRFDASQRGAIGTALGEEIRRTPYTCWACAVMPDHLHLVIRKHRHQAEEMIERLQEATRAALVRDALVPDDHPVWTSGGWRKFLDSAEAVGRCLAYVERNPGREGMPQQAWDFVVPYDGWPFRRRPR
jgi:REP element-mobilizing transposase RayT